MDANEVAERIWDQMHDSLRKGKYYSELSLQYRKRYKWIALGINSAPLIALASVQLAPFLTSSNESGSGQRDPFEISGWIVSLILLLVSLAEGYIAQSNLRGDISASRIMGVQFHKLAERWRILYFHQDRENIVEWVELLDDLTNHMAVEHLEIRNSDLNEQCMKDANYELSQRFGEADSSSEAQTRC